MRATKDASVPVDCPKHDTKRDTRDRGGFRTPTTLVLGRFRATLGNE